MSSSTYPSASLRCVPFSSTHHNTVSIQQTKSSIPTSINASSVPSGINATIQNYSTIQYNTHSVSMNRTSVVQSAQIKPSVAVGVNSSHFVMSSSAVSNQTDIFQASSVLRLNATTALPKINATQGNISSIYEAATSMAHLASSVVENITSYKSSVVANMTSYTSSVVASMTSYTSSVEANIASITSILVGNMTASDNSVVVSATPVNSTAPAHHNRRRRDVVVEEVVNASSSFMINRSEAINDSSSFMVSRTVMESSYLNNSTTPYSTIQLNASVASNSSIMTSLPSLTVSPAAAALIASNSSMMTSLSSLSVSPAAVNSTMISSVFAANNGTLISPSFMGIVSSINSSALTYRTISLSSEVINRTNVFPSSSAYYQSNNATSVLSSNNLNSTLLPHSAGLSSHYISSSLNRTITPSATTPLLNCSFVSPSITDSNYTADCTRECLIKSADELDSFTFKDCFTPYVTEIANSSAVKRRVLSDVIVVKGRHFSTLASDNHVVFSKHTCVVLTSSANEIRCRMDVSSKPPMNTWLPLSMSDEKYGDGFILPEEIHEKSVIFRLSLRDVVPAIGSASGGTPVKLHGYGFHADTVKVSSILPSYLSHEWQCAVF